MSGLEGTIRWWARLPEGTIPAELLARYPDGDDLKTLRVWREELDLCVRPLPRFRNLPLLGSGTGYTIDIKTGEISIYVDEIVLSGTTGAIILPPHIHPESLDGLLKITLDIRVFVPPGEGYVRGIHRLSESTILVMYAPTEKVGLPRYQFQGIGSAFNELGALFGEVLKGRTPEIVHSHPRPVAV